MKSKHLLLAKLYEKFNERDLETLLGTLDPEVDWPNAMEGGRIRGRAGVRAYWEQQWKQLNPSVEPTAFSEDESGRIIAQVRQVVRDLAGSVVLDRAVQHVFTIRDGLILRMEVRDAQERPDSSSMAV